MRSASPIDRRAALLLGSAVVAALLLAVIGSGNPRWFDAALVGYLFATVFAIFSVSYRYLVWLKRPPTRKKSYLMGKFARLGIGTVNLDYNGRLCMVSAGKGNMKALGIDRASNPWSDIPSPMRSSRLAPTSPSARRSPPATSGERVTAVPS